MRCAECSKEASYAVEIKCEGFYSGRTTIWKYLCDRCYKKEYEN